MANTSENTSKESEFLNIPHKVFKDNFIAAITKKDSVLKEIRDCVVGRKAQSCRELLNISIFPGKTYALDTAAGVWTTK